MKLFNLLTRIVCASFLITISPYVFAGWFSGAEAQKVLDQNPQLARAGVLPSNIRVLSGDQCREFSDGNHIRNREAFRASLKGVTFKHTCIRVESDKGFKPYESRYGETRSFTIVLHLDTPKVWRVYETKSTGRKEPPDALKLAEFDINGASIPANSPSTKRGPQ